MFTLVGKKVGGVMHFEKNTPQGQVHTRKHISFEKSIKEKKRKRVSKEKDFPLLPSSLSKERPPKKSLPFPPHPIPTSFFAREATTVLGV